DDHGHFARRPAATQGALEHRTDGTRLARYLRVGSLLGASAENDEKGEESTEESRDDVEDEADDVVAREEHAERDTCQKRQEEREEHVPDGEIVVAPGHLEDLVHLLQTSGLFLRLRGGGVGAGHAY